MSETVTFWPQLRLCMACNPLTPTGAKPVTFPLLDSLLQFSSTKAPNPVTFTTLPEYSPFSSIGFTSLDCLIRSSLSTKFSLHVFTTDLPLSRKKFNTKLKSVRKESPLCENSLLNFSICDRFLLINSATAPVKIDSVEKTGIPMLFRMASPIGYIFGCRSVMSNGCHSIVSSSTFDFWLPACFLDDFFAFFAGGASSSSTGLKYKSTVRENTPEVKIISSKLNSAKPKLVIIGSLFSNVAQLYQKHSRVAVTTRRESGLA